MANTFITPSAIARAGLATLYNRTPMLALTYRDLDSEFGTEKRGNTVNVKKPAVFQALDFDRAQGIQPQDATEGTIPVVLNRIADVSFVVTTEQMTLSIESFQRQLLEPAMKAIAQKIDTSILALRSDITQVAGTHAGAAGDPTNGIDPQTWDRPEVLIEAGRLLDVNSVPTDDRVAVVGPTTKSKWLNTKLLKEAEKSGDTVALRQGSIGKDLFGFESFWTQNVGQPSATPAVGAPTTEIGLAFHKSAFAFVSAPLEIPPGSNAVVETFEGISLRVSYAYDIKYKQTVVSVDTLFGTKTMDANRAVLLKGPNRTA